MYLSYQNNKIVGYTEQPQDLTLYNLDKVEYTENEYVLDGEEYVLKDEAWEEKQAQKEHDRIQELSMTRSDFFDCTIRAWRLREKELLVLIENLLATLPVDEVDKLVAINNFENAQNFYRKHTLFSMIVIAPLKLSETTQVIITDADLDKLFDEVDKGNKATAWEYLPKPVEIVVEPDVDNSEPTINENLTVEDDTDGEVVDNSEE